MTVGLAIVSHSQRLAEGVREVAAQMAPGVAIVAAGGTDDGGIGTSFDRVQRSLVEADSGDGVVVLCDLGSAVLTARTALDFAEAAERIRIADAPLVEGAVAAAVAAEGGAALERVLADARG
ncbi:dihydroxyacetone kinase phosphoryl donor subunit DhaM, partial [Agrococcus sp. HG114]|uniref:dihydroxyacetone kinase phosphoryl donor subunit DhaM n=1 Tax=Agrococcus sp. HG114 TaxID=2969757 RepID=UPI00215A5780